MDYKQCECGGDIIMFTPDLDICKKCGKQYEPRPAPDLLKENQSLKLELQKQKELNAELVNWIKEIPYQWAISELYWGSPAHEKAESLIKKSNEI